MLCVVPDVNVLVSSIITPSGTPGRIYAAWRRRELVFITSPAIIDKTVEVLRRPHIIDEFPIDEADIQALQSLLRRRTVSTPGALDLQVIKEDAEDNAILAAAVEGRADCIISGDRHLKNLGEYQGIPILSPAEFVAQHHIP